MKWTKRLLTLLRFTLFIIATEVPPSLLCISSSVESNKNPIRWKMITTKTEREKIHTNERTTVAVRHWQSKIRSFRLKQRKKGIRRNSSCLSLSTETSTRISCSNAFRQFKRKSTLEFFASGETIYHIFRVASAPINFLISINFNASDTNTSKQILHTTKPKSKRTDDFALDKNLTRRTMRNSEKISVFDLPKTKRRKKRSERNPKNFRFERSSVVRWTIINYMRPRVFCVWCAVHSNRFGGHFSCQIE